MRLWLEQAQHTCSHFELGEAFLKDFGRNSYDLLILDWELPDVNGLDVLRQVRATQDWRLPILFATQRDDERDVVEALQNGADDYMTKPINKMEMLARVTALARRTQGYVTDNARITFPPYEIDLEKHVVSLNGQPVKLSNKEYELVVFLFKNVGHVVSRNHLLESVWGIRSEINTRTIDTHVSRIRNKLSLSPDNGWRLTSIYQHGYRLEQSPALV